MSFGRRCRPSHRRPLSPRIRGHHLPPTPRHSCPSPPTVSGPHLAIQHTAGFSPQAGSGKCGGESESLPSKLSLGPGGWSQEETQMIAVMYDPCWAQREPVGAEDRAPTPGPLRAIWLYLSLDLFSPPRPLSAVAQGLLPPFPPGMFPLWPPMGPFPPVPPPPSSGDAVAPPSTSAGESFA